MVALFATLSGSVYALAVGYHAGMYPFLDFVSPLLEGFENPAVFQPCRQESVVLSMALSRGSEVSG